MMDAVVVLKTIGKMCKSYDRCTKGCPLYGICVCRDEEEANPELIIAAVEEWRKDHPAKTRQSEFLKFVPDAPTDADGNVLIYPCLVDKKMKVEKCGNKGCPECTREFWREEIE